MKQKLIDNYLRDRKADEIVMSALRRFPDEAYQPLMQIKADYNKDDNSDKAIRRFQLLCRKYLSDDEELMRLIDGDEKEFPYND